MAKIGVLAVQGGFAAHIEMLRGLGHEAVEVRQRDVLLDLQGLVLPGGESSVQLHLLHRLGLWEALKQFAQRGYPIFGTCAGLILLSREVESPQQESLGWLDIKVRRNGWGRQIESREDITAQGLPMVLIRAPRILEVGASVEVLDRCQGEPVLVRQGNCVGATFHPELTTSYEVHQMVFGRV